MLFTTVVFAHHSSAGVTLKSKLYLAINSLDELQREPESGSLKNNLIGYIRRAREEGGDEERKIITIFHFSYQDDANVSFSGRISHSLLSLTVTRHVHHVKAKLECVFVVCDFVTK